MLDHQYIEENQVIDRYVMGKLTDEEHQNFSEHFLDCPACLDQLELAEAFQRDLKTVVAQDLTRQVKQGLLARFLRSGFMSGAILAAAAVMFMAFIFPVDRAGTPEIAMVSNTRGAQAAGIIELAFSEKISDYILVRDVVLSKTERESAFYRAELLNEDGVRVLYHEAAINDGAIKLRLENLSAGDYKLVLELARDGQLYKPHETLTVNVSQN